MKIICLWSGPRNVSTALMYSFAQRSDTRVVDEPLYGHYLRVSGAVQPGGDEVMQKMNCDGDEVMHELLSQTTRSVDILFIKQMAHHLIELDLSPLSRTQNAFLIRDPKDMLPSLTVQIPHAGLADTGLQRQWELFRELKDRGQSPCIIDSRELLLDPSGVIETFCHHLGIEFDAAMLSWPAGPIEQDGVWAKQWYHAVHKSTGFSKYVVGQRSQEGVLIKEVVGTVDRRACRIGLDQAPVGKEVRQPIAATKKHPRRVDYEYERAGVANVFMFAEPLSGWREVAVRESKTKVDWAIEMANLLEGRYADCEKVLLVCDNLNTHTKGAFYEVFEPEHARSLVRRIEFHYTPKHGSWLNIAENELSSMTRQCVHGRRIGDIETLREETSAWATDVNDTQRGVDWQMKIDDARTKLTSVYPKIKL